MASKKVFLLMEQLAVELANEIREEYGESIALRVGEVLTSAGRSEPELSDTFTPTPRTRVPGERVALRAIPQPDDWPKEGRVIPTDSVTTALREEDMTEGEVRDVHWGLIEKLQLDALPLELLVEPFGLTIGVLETLKSKFGSSKEAAK